MFKKKGEKKRKKKDTYIIYEKKKKEMKKKDIIYAKIKQMWKKNLTNRILLLKHSVFKIFYSVNGIK